MKLSQIGANFRASPLNIVVTPDIPSQTASSESTPLPKAPETSLREGSRGLRGLHDSLQHKGDKFKSHLPAFVNDHVGSVICAAHLIGEISMLKSNGLVFWENKRFPGGKVNPLIDPARNMLRALSGAEKGGINNWGTRSTMIGTLGWTLGTFLPDAKQDPAFEEQEKAKLAGKSFLQKSGIHLKEALSITNPHYKRQMVGLTSTLAGVCSMMSGLNSVDKFGGAYINRSRSLGGLVTTAAGSLLLLTDDTHSAWMRYGFAKWLRLGFAYGSIQRMREKATERLLGEGLVDNSWKYYLGGQVGLQGGGLLGILLGGDALGTSKTSPSSDVLTSAAVASAPVTQIETSGAARIDPVAPSRTVSA